MGDGNSDGFEGFIKDMNDWDKKRPKFLKWIDTWFGGSLAGYRVSYSIIRPHLVLAEFGREIKWAWQRVFRGWDDRACWSVDYWLDNLMPQILKQLQTIKHGTPFEFYDSFQPDENYNYSDKDQKKAEELWNAEIEKMIFGFIASKMLDDVEFKTREQYLEDTEALEKVRLEGMNSFVKYYHALWD